MRSRGNRLFELAVVVGACGIVAGLVLERVVPLIARSERVAFTQVRGQLQSALLLEAAERIASGRASELAELVGTNPMELVIATPSNYAGALGRAEAERVAPASWYFDESTRRLVYRVGRLVEIETAAGISDRIELAVEFVYDDRDGNGQYDADSDGYGGLRLEPVREFEWHFAAS